MNEWARAKIEGSVEVSREMLSRAHGSYVAEAIADDCERMLDTLRQFVGRKRVREIRELAKTSPYWRRRLRFVTRRRTRR